MLLLTLLSIILTPVLITSSPLPFSPFASPFTLSSPTSSPADILLAQRPPSEIPLDEEDFTTPNSNNAHHQEGEELLNNHPDSRYIEPAKPPPTQEELRNTFDLDWVRFLQEEEGLPDCDGVQRMCCVSEDFDKGCSSYSPGNPACLPNFANMRCCNFFTDPSTGKAAWQCSGTVFAPTPTNKGELKSW